MSLADEIDDLLGEARMRDVRRNKAKVPSGSQAKKSFKTTMQELSGLSAKLASMGLRDMGSDVDDLAGQLRRLEKDFETAEQRGDLSGAR